MNHDGPIDRGMDAGLLLPTLSHVDLERVDVVGNEQRTHCLLDLLGH